MEEESYSAEEAQKRAEKLPAAAKEMLYSPEMGRIIRSVGQKHQLHIDQMDLLSTEAGQVILGFIEPKKFPQSISETFRIDQASANAIAQDINTLLFEKIRSAMKSGAEVALTQKTITPPAPVTPTPKEELPIPQTLPRATSPQTPTPPPGPRNYKTDPYREPLEG